MRAGQYERVKGSGCRVRRGQTLQVSLSRGEGSLLVGFCSKMEGTWKVFVLRARF